MVSATEESKVGERVDTKCVLTLLHSSLVITVA